MVVNVEVTVTIVIIKINIIINFSCPENNNQNYKDGPDFPNGKSFCIQWSIKDCSIL